MSSKAKPGWRTPDTTVSVNPRPLRLPPECRFSRLAGGTATDGGFVAIPGLDTLAPHGAIDDFRVYRRALTPAEITALYNLR